jgi:prepilin-type N-terminal cleavage/methylation domain-containing protein
MKYRVSRSGFTLVEMLVAMTIVVSIVSMVYGSYFATAKSADVYKAMMTASESAGGLLQQMTRQIRCSYAGTAEASPASAEKTLVRTQGILEEPVSYFKGGSDLPNGEILHLITTARFSGLDDCRDGLFDVVYKFDKSARTLLVSQRRFVETPAGLAQNREFTPVIEGLEDIGLQFFNGAEWADQWDFTQAKKLPRAVRISIACKDENGRKCAYSAVAGVYCLMDQSKREKAK